MSQSAQARRGAEKRGLRAEWLARIYLGLKGYRCLAARAKTPVGEIDLVMRRGSLVVFVEVKARRTFRDAAEAIGPRSQSRIAAAARAWLAVNPRYQKCDARFDGIFVVQGQWPQHLKNAFDAGPVW